MPRADSNREASPPPDSFQPRSRADWRKWLAKHHTRNEGVWVVTFRRGAGETIVGYDDLVEEALCFGWIDSRPRKLDERRTMLWFSPRKPKSAWSRPNKERVDRLVAAGLMTSAGQAKIDAAKRDGTWTKLDAVENLEVPDYLARALASLPPAAENFAAFPRSAKRGILEWIAQARQPATRTKRIDETARLAQVNQRANQWRPK
jgi:uncharacterized protein YdeI (YjbR/CyaY-like superfamily)